jgi:hypothetical protein
VISRLSLYTVVGAGSEDEERALQVLLPGAPRDATSLERLSARSSRCPDGVGRGEPIYSDCGNCRGGHSILVPALLAGTLGQGQRTELEGETRD